MHIGNHISSPISPDTWWVIAWVRPNKNHNCHKTNLSAIKRYYPFKKYVRRGRGRGVLKKRTKTNRGSGGQAYLYVRPVKKIPDFSNSKQEFFLMSCFAVAKGFAVLSLVQDIKLFFLLKSVDIFFIWRFSWTFKYFYCHGVWLCKKHWSLIK